MKSLALLLSLLALQAVNAHAQIRTDQPFVLPQTIFVGDLGRMVVPLDHLFSGTEPFILETPERLPQTPDLIIRRIELERRGGVSRLLIDFVPFVTGTIPFPDIEFFLLEDTASPAIPAITGLEVHVTSILTPSQMALSESAPPLAVPGTSFLIYGTITLILLLLFLGIGGSFWGRRHFYNLWERLRRRFILQKMRKFIRQLRQEIGEDIGLENKLKPAHYLSRLSAEFREFLTIFTGINCRSLTAGEFLALPIVYLGPGPTYLSGLFQTWDTLRFSGRGMEMMDLVQAMAEIEEFLSDIETAEKAGAG